MIHKSLQFVLFVLVHLGCSSNPEDNLQETYGQIIYTAVVFRHGDRAPNQFYPNDPYNISYWPVGIGQLTKIGKRQEFKLGQWLRQRYFNFVEGGYNASLVKMNSSDVDRTLMSAESVLAGMFPPLPVEKFDNATDWQPIPVHAYPKPYDRWIGMNEKCDRYTNDKLVLNQSPEFQAIFQENSELFEYAEVHSGVKFSRSDVIGSISDLWDLYDTLLIEDLYNLTLPNWTKKVYPNPLYEVSKYFFANAAYTVEMQRLRAGPLLGSIIDDLKKRRDNSSDQSIHLISAHDTTLSALMMTLQIFNYEAPPYGAALLIELRKKGDELIVTISYKNSTTELPYLLEIPGCNKICTLDGFITATSDRVPEDWNAECAVGVASWISNLSWWYIGGLVVVMILAGFLIYALLKLCFARRRMGKYSAMHNLLNTSQGTYVPSGLMSHTGQQKEVFGMMPIKKRASKN